MKNGKFTDEEVEAIKNHLTQKRYKVEFIVKFISALENLIDGRAKLQKRRATKDKFIELEKMKNCFKAAQKYIKKIENDPFILRTHDSLLGYAAPDFIDWVRYGEKNPPELFILKSFGVELKELQYGLLLLLDVIDMSIDLGRSHALKPGREKANSDHFFTVTLRLFQSCFNDPSAISATPEGFIFQLFSIILESMGLPFEDPTRAIKSAVQQIKNEMTKTLK